MVNDYQSEILIAIRGWFELNLYSFVTSHRINFNVLNEKYPEEVNQIETAKRLSICSISAFLLSIHFPLHRFGNSMRSILS
jgi:hypothetical protein